MINLKNLDSNVFIIYDALNLNPFNSQYYLIGFKNGFTREWTYVIPTVLQQNTRFTKFEVTLTIPTAADPENGMINLYPMGNYDFVLYGTGIPNEMDPENGELLMKGQMYLQNTIAEVTKKTYISDNESGKSIVYLTRNQSLCPAWSTQPDIWSVSAIIWSECEVDPCPQWNLYPIDWDQTPLQWNECIAQ